MRLPFRIDPRALPRRLGRLLLAPPVLVALILASVTVAAAVAAERGVRQAEHALLDDRLGDVATLVDALSTRLSSSIQDGASSAAVAKLDGNAWKADYGARADFDMMTRAALLDVRGAQVVTIASVGGPGAIADKLTPSALRGEPGDMSIRAAGIGGSLGAVLIGYARTVPGYPGRVVYVELDASAVVRSFLAAHTDEIEGVLYFGTEPGGLVVASSTTRLPLKGEVTGTTLEVGPGWSTYLQIRAPHPLVPSWATMAPPSILLAGLAMTLGIGAVIEASRRRRAAAERTAAELERLAAVDALTGVASRAAAVAQLDAHLRERDPAAVAVVDVVAFRAVNEGLGHAAGDRLLVEVAHRVREAAGPGTLTARLGSDEFAVVAPDSAEVVEAVKRIHAAFERPFRLAGRDGRVEVAVGIAEADGLGDAGAVLGDADLALREAKRAPGLRLRSCTHDLRAAAQERLALIEALPCAGARGELELVYQPLCSLADGRTLALEVLARWRRNGHLLPPGSFIPLAEESGAIVELGQAVLRQALADVVTVHGRYPHARVQVNVSARELGEGDYPERLAALLEHSGVAPEWLILEVTESLTVGRDAERLLHALRALGVGLAIDDFGAGYSNFATLQRLPVEQVKVDRALLANARGGSRASFLKAAVDVIKSVGLTAVCEGIETDAQHALVRDAGFDVAQGFLFGRPAPLDELVRASAA